MNFIPIDQSRYARAQQFYYFARMAPTGYSLSVKIDVLPLYNAAKRTKTKFFPGYLWLVTRALSEQPEFTTAIVDGVLGYYDTLTPLYAAFHDDDKTFSLMWTEFDPDYAKFYAAYCENQTSYGETHGVLAQPQTPPPNAYTVSAMPWVHFEHFAVHSYEQKDYFFPSVEAGKFERTDNALLMPLSITAHHATTDGWHIATFLDRLRDDINNCEALMFAHFDSESGK